MSQLIELEKQNGKQKLLIPAKEIQEPVEQLSMEDFTRLVEANDSTFATT